MTKTKDLRNLQEARDAHDLPVHSSCRRSETPGLTGFLGQEQVPVPETQHQQVSQLPLLLRYPCQECRQENMRRQEFWVSHAMCFPKRTRLTLESVCVLLFRIRGNTIGRNGGTWFITGPTGWIYVCPLQEERAQSQQ